MITFKFDGHKVTFANGKVHSEDEITQMILEGLVACSSDGTEMGYPLLNTITNIFGDKSITDLVIDEPDNIIY
jgi:hypothetical protein